MRRALRQTVPLLLVVPFLISCGKVAENWAGIREGIIDLSDIFTVVSKTTATADGFDESELVIRVHDKNGTPKENRTVSFSAAVEAGVNHISCTPSDAQGLIVCKVRAHRDGVKNLKMAGREQTVQLEFTRSFDQAALLVDEAGGSHMTTAAGGDLVTATAGKKWSPPLVTQSEATLRADVSVVF